MKKTSSALETVSRRVVVDISVDLGRQIYDPVSFGLGGGYRQAGSRHQHFYHRWHQIMADDDSSAL